MSAITDFYDYFTDFRDAGEVIKDYYPQKPLEGTNEYRKYELVLNTCKKAKKSKSLTYNMLFNAVIAFTLSAIGGPGDYVNAGLRTVAKLSSTCAAISTIVCVNLYNSLPEKNILEEPSAPFGQKV